MKSAATSAFVLARVCPVDGACVAASVGRIEQGETNMEIANALFVATTTVRRHLEHIFEKLEVRNRAAAAAVYVSAHDLVTS
jgi:hypothetical protein